MQRFSSGPQWRIEVSVVQKRRRVERDNDSSAATELNQYKAHHLYLSPSVLRKACMINQTL